MIRSERMTADLDGEFVVFMIGMRINAPLKVHKWLPVIRAMPRMLVELHRRPELGFIHAEVRGLPARRRSWSSIGDR